MSFPCLLLDAFFPSTQSFWGSLGDVLFVCNTLVPSCFPSLPSLPSPLLVPWPFPGGCPWRAKPLSSSVPQFWLIMRRTPLSVSSPPLLPRILARCLRAGSRSPGLGTESENSDDSGFVWGWACLLARFGENSLPRGSLDNPSSEWALVKLFLQISRQFWPGPMPAANLAFSDTVPPLHTSFLFINWGLLLFPDKRPAVLSTLALTDSEGHYHL